MFLWENRGEFLGKSAPKTNKLRLPKIHKTPALSQPFPVNLRLEKTSGNASGGGSGCPWKIKISGKSARNEERGRVCAICGGNSDCFGGEMEEGRGGEKREGKGRAGRAWHCPHARAGTPQGSQIFAWKANEGPGEENPAPEGSLSLISNIPLPAPIPAPSL